MFSNLCESKQSPYCLFIIMMLVCLGASQINGVYSETNKSLVVSGDSMSPTFNNTDTIHYDPSNNQDVVVGDIVVFTKLPSSKTLIVKRVVGLSGDIIEFKSNVVFCNGELVGISNDDSSTLYTYDQKIIVGEGEMYLLGDNYNNSIDSRSYGCVKVENIKGVVKGTW